MTQPEMTPSLHGCSCLPINYDITNYDLASFNFKRLTVLKQGLQDELVRLGELLKEQKVDMNTPLLSMDGFPRADLDIVLIRHLRQRIIILRNDFEKVMKEVERAMMEQFNNSNNSTEQESNTVGLESHIANGLELIDDEPFMWVQDVLPQSPAFQAGLQENDKIIKFGPLCHSNTKDIQIKNGKLYEVAKIAKERENTEISIVILRSSGKKTVTLTPHSDWSGIGLLGCKLVQL